MPSTNLNTKKLKVTELDFDLIKDSLKDFLRNQDQFADYDFEGSGLSILIDLLAYNTHYNAFYTNMIANEMFLDSATLRESVVSLAKQLGYTPTSTTGAKATINLTFSPNDLGGFDGSSQSSYTLLGTEVVIPRGSVFTTEMEDKTYSFITVGSYTAIPTANSSGGYLVNESVNQSPVVPYIATGVEIVEGVYSYTQYVYNSQVNQNFIIPSENVNTDTIVVLVTDTSAGTSGTSYILAENYSSLTSESEVFFLQETSKGNYEIYFGDGNLGKQPSDGNIIDITYVVSAGEAGNGATIFKSDPIKSPASSATYQPQVTTNINASGGKAKESIESIKFLAPRNFESQNRAVTTDDYIVKVLSDYSQLDAVHCWGGEENDPPDYGKVYLSIKPKKGYILTDFEKEKIKTTILKSRNIITVEPILVDPDYLFLVVDTSIKWDSRITSLTGSVLKVGIRDEIVQWGQNNLEKFESYFRYSALLRSIDNYNEGIINNETSTRIRKEVVPVLNSSGTYTLEFGNPLFYPHTGHQGTLISSTFNYSGYVGCVLKDKDNVLEIYGNSALAQNILVSSNAGSIDYDKGKITLVGFSPSLVNNGGVLSITVNSLKQDVVPKNNQLITIRDSDLTVKMFDDASSLTGTLQSTRTNVGPSSTSGPGSY